MDSEGVFLGFVDLDGISYIQLFVSASRLKASKELGSEASRWM
jgi:hypothetical protein